MSDQRTTTTGVSTRSVPRTRGATSGILLVVLGAWGALIPFIGPSFGWGWNSDQSWHWTAARGWYEVLPGALTIVAGVLLLIGTTRTITVLGGLLGVIAGGWFVIGAPLSPALTLGTIGPATGGKVTDAIAPQTQHALKELTYFYLLGAVIIFVAAAALGRLTVVSLRDMEHAERRETERAEAEREAQRLAAERYAAERDAAEREAVERAVAEREAANRAAAENGEDQYASPPTSPYGGTHYSDDAPTSGSGYGTPQGYGNTSEYGGGSAGYGTQAPPQSSDTEEASGYRPPDNRG